MFKNLTGFEIDSLGHAFNLTDGHMFRRWSPAEDEIIGRAGDLFRTATRQRQAEIEREYLRDFSRLARQTFDDRALGYLTCFTASMAFEVVANHLRATGRSVALVEPCFDNLADIFLRHGLPVRPVPDDLLDAPERAFVTAVAATDADAVCLVTPNNPTGRELSEANLRAVARFCADTGKLLILDKCFRGYLPRPLVHDQYRIVLDAGADAVLVEDTGKTWPTSEIKAPFFAVTRAGGLYDRVYDIYTDFLLHVSPVGIKLMHEFIKLSLRDDLAAVHDAIRANRRALYAGIAGTFLTPCERPFVSVAWLRIDHALTAAELKRELDARGVFVLPGTYFYWHDRSLGEHHIRVALTRDADVVAAAAAELGAVCRGLARRPEPAIGGVS